MPDTRIPMRAESYIDGAGCQSQCGPLNVLCGIEYDLAVSRRSRTVSRHCCGNGDRPTHSLLPRDQIEGMKLEDRTALLLGFGDYIDDIIGEIDCRRAQDSD